MRIHPNDTLCIAIDFQVKLLTSIHESERLIHNTQILLQGLKALNVPFLITQHYTKGLGATEPSLSAIMETEPMEKMTFSALDTEEIKTAIASSGKKSILICGAEAHICVLQTLIDLQAQGYQVVFVSDCTGSRTENNHALAMQRAMQEGALVTTYEAILFELTRKAGTDAFKAIMKLVK